MRIFVKQVTQGSKVQFQWKLVDAFGKDIVDPDCSGIAKDLETALALGRSAAREKICSHEGWSIYYV